MQHFGECMVPTKRLLAVADVSDMLDLHLDGKKHDRQLMLHTVDGRNPKQPPGMYNTL